MCSSQYTILPAEASRLPWLVPLEGATWALAASTFGPVGHGGSVGPGIEDQQLAGLDGQLLHLRVVGHGGL